MSQKKRVLISNSVYNFFIYLLYSTETEIKQTFYFVGEGIPRSITDNLVQHYYYTEDTKFKKSKYWKLFIKIFAVLRWPFLVNASLYGLDHYWFIIGNRYYTYIEDAPNIFSLYTKGHKLYKIQVLFWEKKSALIQFMYKLVFGGVYHRNVANNHQCIRIIQTQNDYVDYLKGKEIVVIDTKEYWDKASEAKKTLILSFFNITQADVDVIKSKKTIIFTQPFVTDNFLTEEEHVEVYDKILANYDPKEVIIKPHPRDAINYKKYFPAMLLFEKPVPMQLFDLLDIKFETAATVSSTAIVSIPYDIKIDWYGSKIHPKILKEYGDIKLEDIRK